MRELRNKDPELFRLITIRTGESRLWITPNSRVRKLVGGIISRYQEMCSIEIFAYSVLGNHFHLLIRAPEQNTDEFCENVNREIARRVNWIHKRQGNFWGRRYVDQEVLSEHDLTETFLYVCTNPTGHGLVKDPSHWPGLNCVEHVIKETDRCFSFHHYSNPHQPITKHKLKISILPPFQKLTKNKRKQHIRELIVERTKRIIKEREEAGQGFIDLETLREQEPGERPKKTKSSPRAPFYTKNVELAKEKRAQLKELRKAYDNASFRYRLGHKDVEFPEFTYLPPLHRAPRLLPFTPILKVQ